MTDLIDRQAAIKYLMANMNWYYEDGYEPDEDYKRECITELINGVPSAQPVRHGKWIWKGEDGDSRWMCSECKCKEYVPTCNGVPNIWNYCPNCGCRMDAE